MKAYYVNCDVEDGQVYHLTLKAAKAAAREAAKLDGNSVDVQAVTILTDREHILRMVNDQGGHTVFGDVVFTAKARRA